MGSAFDYIVAIGDVLIASWGLEKTAAFLPEQYIFLIYFGEGGELLDEVSQ